MFRPPSRTSSNLLGGSLTNYYYNHRGESATSSLHSGGAQEDAGDPQADSFPIVDIHKGNDTLSAVHPETSASSRQYYRRVATRNLVHYTQRESDADEENESDEETDDEPGDNVTTTASPPHVRRRKREEQRKTQQPAIQHEEYIYGGKVVKIAATGSSTSTAKNTVASGIHTSTRILVPLPSASIAAANTTISTASHGNNGAFGSDTHQISKSELSSDELLDMLLVDNDADRDIRSQSFSSTVDFLGDSKRSGPSPAPLLSCSLHEPERNPQPQTQLTTPQSHSHVATLNSLDELDESLANMPLEALEAARGPIVSLSSSLPIPTASTSMTEKEKETAAATGLPETQQVSFRDQLRTSVQSIQEHHVSPLRALLSSAALQSVSPLPAKRPPASDLRRLPTLLSSLPAPVHGVSSTPISPIPEYEPGFGLEVLPAHRRINPELYRVHPAATEVFKTSLPRLRNHDDVQRLLSAMPTPTTLSSSCAASSSEAGLLSSNRPQCAPIDMYVTRITEAKVYENEIIVTGVTDNAVKVACRVVYQPVFYISLPPTHAAKDELMTTESLDILLDRLNIMVMQASCGASSSFRSKGYLQQHGGSGAASMKEGTAANGYQKPTRVQLQKWRGKYRHYIRDRVTLDEDNDSTFVHTQPMPIHRECTDGAMKFFQATSSLQAERIQRLFTQSMLPHTIPQKLQHLESERIKRLSPSSSSSSPSNLAPSNVGSSVPTSSGNDSTSGLYGHALRQADTSPGMLRNDEYPNDGKRTLRTSNVRDDVQGGKRHAAHSNEDDHEDDDDDVGDADSVLMAFNDAMDRAESGIDPVLSGGLGRKRKRNRSGGGIGIGRDGGSMTSTINAMRLSASSFSSDFRASKAAKPSDDAGFGQDAPSAAVKPNVVRGMSMEEALNTPPPILSLTQCQRTDMVGYERTPLNVLRVQCASPYAYLQVVKLFQKGQVRFPRSEGQPCRDDEYNMVPLSEWKFQDDRYYITCYNTEFKLSIQMQALYNLRPETWIRVSRYEVVEEMPEFGIRRQMNPDMFALELSVPVCDITSLEHRTDIPRLYYAALDVETICGDGERKRKPVATNRGDLVIMASASIYKFGEASAYLKQAELEMTQFYRAYDASYGHSLSVDTAADSMEHKMQHAAVVISDTSINKTSMVESKEEKKQIVSPTLDKPAGPGAPGTTSATTTATAFHDRVFSLGRSFSGERQMLDTLYDYLVQFDGIVTWNGILYDIPYLMTRALECESKLVYLSMYNNRRVITQAQVDTERRRNMIQSDQFATSTAAKRKQKRKKENRKGNAKTGLTGAASMEYFLRDRGEDHPSTWNTLGFDEQRNDAEDGWDNESDEDQREADNNEESYEGAAVAMDKNKTPNIGKAGRAAAGGRGGNNTMMEDDRRLKIELDGFQHHDLMVADRKSNPWRSSYRLKEVCEFVLPVTQRKLDVDIAEMRGMFIRRELDKWIQYNARDCQCLIYLDKVLHLVLGSIQTTSLCYLTDHQLYTGGQKQRVWHSMGVKVTTGGWALNRRKLTILCAAYSDFIYNGGNVSNPTMGLHEMVLWVDFASLYPSLVCQYNLCYSTMIHPNKITEFKGKYPHVRVVSQGNKDNESESTHWVHFAQDEKNVLPQLMHDGMDNRQRVKDAIKAVAKKLGEATTDEEKDSLMALIRSLKAKEQAIKTTNNSAYGFAGSSDIKGKLSKKERLIQERRLAAMKRLAGNGMVAYDYEYERYTRPGLSAMIIAIVICSKGRRAKRSATERLVALAPDITDEEKRILKYMYGREVTDLLARDARDIYGDTDSAGLKSRLSFADIRELCDRFRISIGSPGTGEEASSSTRGDNTELVFAERAESSSSDDEDDEQQGSEEEQHCVPKSNHDKDSVNDTDLRGDDVQSMRKDRSGQWVRETSQSVEQTQPAVTTTAMITSSQSDRKRREVVQVQCNKHKKHKFMRPTTRKYISKREQQQMDEAFKLVDMLDGRNIDSHFHPTEQLPSKKKKTKQTTRGEHKRIRTTIGTAASMDRNHGPLAASSLVSSGTKDSAPLQRYKLQPLYSEPFQRAIRAKFLEQLKGNLKIINRDFVQEKKNARASSAGLTQSSTSDATMAESKEKKKDDNGTAGDVRVRMSLECENINTVLLTEAKKNYVKLAWADADAKPDIKVLGMACKRRDRSKLTRDIVDFIAKDFVMTRHPDERNPGCFRKATITEAIRYLIDIVVRLKKPHDDPAGYPLNAFARTVELKDDLLKNTTGNRIRNQVKEHDPLRTPEAGERVYWIHRKLPSGAVAKQAHEQELELGLAEQWYKEDREKLRRYNEQQRDFAKHKHVDRVDSQLPLLTKPKQRVQVDMAKFWCDAVEKHVMRLIQARDPTKGHFLTIRLFSAIRSRLQCKKPFVLNKKKSKKKAPLALPGAAAAAGGGAVASAEMMHQKQAMKRDGIERLFRSSHTTATFKAPAVPPHDMSPPDAVHGHTSSRKPDTRRSSSYRRHSKASLSSSSTLSNVMLRYLSSSSSNHAGTTAHTARVARRHALD